MSQTVEIPDLDALVLAALRASDLGVPASVLMPQGDAEHVPRVIARQVSGGSGTRLGTVVGIVDLQALDTTRAGASSLARRAVAALMDAARAQFSHGGAHLGTATLAAGGPTEIRTGDPAPDPSLFRFQTTLRVTARTTL